MKPNRLKEIRKGLKLTQTAFGYKFKVPMRSIQNWESGKTEPPPYILWMIERILILENELDEIKGGQLLLDPKNSEKKTKRL